MTTTQKTASPARTIQSPAANPAQLTAQWAEARLVYPIYAAIVKKFSLGEPCADLESATEDAKPEQILRARRWLDEMDHLIQVHQFRQFLQSPLYQNPSEQGLRALVLRHLLRTKKTSTDCDKIDFLLVQYFALCAPVGVSSQKIELEQVAEVLKPVLGQVDLRPLDWFEALEQLVQALSECQSLRDVMESGFLEQGRELKAAAGDMFFYPSALVAFVRFNFLVRRAFIRLMHADLRAIQSGLGKLESLGIKAVDCHGAGLSSTEPVARLGRLCAEWKQPFAGSYSETSVGHSFGKLLAIRAAVEGAAQQGKPQPQPAAAAKVSAPPEKSSANKPAKPATAAPPNAPAKNAAVPPAESVKAAPKAAPGAPAKPTARTRSGPAKAPAQARPAAAAAPVSAPATATPAAGVDPEACVEAIWEQLIEAPPSRGRSMTSVTYENTKMLLSSWEVSAFVSDGGKISEDLRHGVVARLLVAVAMDAFKRANKSASLDPTLLHAHSAAAKLQECVEQAKKAKNTEGAVNLSITAKRLLAYIEEAEVLRS
jgi:hypothetical protein